MRTPEQIVKRYLGGETTVSIGKTYYELTMYFDVWNKEIVGYGLVSRKGGYKIILRWIKSGNRPQKKNKLTI